MLWTVFIKDLAQTRYTVSLIQNLRIPRLRFDEGLTLETSALELLTVANAHYQLSWSHQNTCYSYRRSTKVSLESYSPLFLNQRYA